MIEHYGRRCQGLIEGVIEGLLEPVEENGAGAQSERPEQCDYRFRFKECPHCGGENDIAARKCHQCQQAIIDPDDQLKDALKLKDAMVIRCAGITLSASNGSSDSKLKITYHGEDGEELSESFDFSKPAQRHVFNKLFGRRFANSQAPKEFKGADEVLEMQALLPAPDFVIARNQKHYWQVQERIFDYRGNYRKAY